MAIRSLVCLSAAVLASADVSVMARALDTGDLPPHAAEILWPWIEAIEAASPQTGSAVRLEAENAIGRFRLLMVRSAPLDILIDDALQASDALARENCLRRLPQARLEALLALNALITWMREAKPNPRAGTVDAAW